MFVEDKYVKDEKRCEFFFVGCVFENKLVMQFMYINLKFRRNLGENSLNLNYFLIIIISKEEIF